MQEADSPQSKTRNWRPAEAFHRIGKRAVLFIVVGGLLVWLLFGHATHRTAPPPQSGMRKDYLVPPRLSAIQSDPRDTRVLYIPFICHRLFLPRFMWPIWRRIPMGILFPCVRCFVDERTCSAMWRPQCTCPPENSS